MPYRSIRGVLVVIVLLLIGAVVLGGFFVARRIVPHEPGPAPTAPQ